MTQIRDDICIVIPWHLCTTPRAVKEADALVAAGFRVRVVSALGPIERQRADDKAIAASRNWSWDPIGMSRIHAEESFRYWRSTLSYKFFSRLPRFTWIVPGVVERGERRGFTDLAAKAASQPANLFIGHYPAGLAAAAKAAAKCRAKLGYDAEDFHTGEQDGSKAGRRSSALIARIEGRCLPMCSYITASSPGIAAAYSNKYGINPPITVQNVFPFADRDSTDGKVKERRSASFSIYWFSQTIGPDRGIEYAIKACATLNRPFELHLQGTVAPRYKAELMQLAQAHEMADHLFFHEQCPFGELLSRAAEHDVGLALEQRQSENRDLCQTNKIFMYLLAGLAVVATDTSGQRAVLETCPSTSSLVPHGDVRMLGNSLRFLQEDPERLRRHKESALNAARQNWNWETSSKILVSAVRGVLADRPASSDEMPT